MSRHHALTEYVHHHFSEAVDAKEFFHRLAQELPEGVEVRPHNTQISLAWAGERNYPVAELSRQEAGAVTLIDLYADFELEPPKVLLEFAAEAERKYALNRTAADLLSERDDELKEIVVQVLKSFSDA